MNFPMEYPLFQFVYWLLNTPGLGGIAVALVGGGSILVYSVAIRWIAAKGKSRENERFAYPTPSLHAHLEEKGLEEKP